MSSWIDNARSNWKGNDVVDGCPELVIHVISDTLLKREQRTPTKLNLTRLKTVRDRSNRVNRPNRLEETRMKDALEIATSPGARQIISHETEASSG